jgi:hypothetical protein
MKKALLLTSSLLLPIAAQSVAPVQPARGGDAYETSKHETVELLLTCLEAEKSNGLVTAKATCKDTDEIETKAGEMVPGEKTETNKKAVIQRLYDNNPRLQEKFSEFYRATTDYTNNDAAAAAIEAVIGSDNVEDIQEYRAEIAQDEIGEAIRKCREFKPTNKETCFTEYKKDSAGKYEGETDYVSTNAVVTTTKEKLCQLNGKAADQCTAEQVYAAVEEVAEKELAEATKRCVDTGRRRLAYNAACITDLKDKYEERTGKSLDNTKLKEKQSQAGQDKASAAVTECNKDIVKSDFDGDRAGLALAVQECRKGAGAKDALADSLGIDKADITDTEVVKAARGGAKDAGKKGMKAGKTVDTIKTEMAEASGKIADATCEAKATWTADCFTEIDARKMVQEGAGECLMDAMKSCLEVKDAASADTDCSAKALKTAVTECGGGTITDADANDMAKKQQTKAVTDAFKAAKGLSADEKKTAAKAALATALGKAAVEVTDKEYERSKRDGAAKELAETATAWKESGEAADVYAARMQSAFEDATGKTYSKTEVKKLQEKGAKSELIEMMSACSKSAVAGGGNSAAIKTAKENCAKPAEKKQIKNTLATAMGKDAAPDTCEAKATFVPDCLDKITDTKFNTFLKKGAREESFAAIESCNQGLDKADNAAKQKIKDCADPATTTGAEVYDKVKESLGKPDMTNKDIANFLKKGAKDGMKDEFQACLDAAADATAKRSCKGGQKDILKNQLGKPDMPDEVVEKELVDIVDAMIGDEMEICMEAQDRSDLAKKRVAATACRTKATTKMGELTSATDDVKMQERVRKAAAKKVGTEVDACRSAKASVALEKAKCGDPKENPELKDSIAKKLGKAEVTDNEARKFVKKAGQQETMSFLKTCKEDGSDYTASKTEALQKLKDTTGNDAATEATLMEAINDGVTTELKDAYAACKVIKKTVANTDCNAVKRTAYKNSKGMTAESTAAGYKTDKQVDAEAERAIKKGVVKAVVNSKNACLDLAGDNATAKTACNTNELANAKKAKAEAEGVLEAGLKDSEVAKDMKKGKREDVAEAMTSCTDRAAAGTTGTALATRNTELEACRQTALTVVAKLEGKTVDTGRRLLVAMKLDTIKEQVNKASVGAFGKKSAACMEAADYASDKPAAVAACQTAKKDRAEKALGKPKADLGDDDIKELEESAAAAEIGNVNRAIKKAVAADNTLAFTDTEKKAMRKEAVNKISSTDGTTIKKNKMKKLGDRAGAKSVLDKVEACLKVNADVTAAKALAGCAKTDLLADDKDARGVAAGGDDDEERVMRKAVQEKIKTKFNACGKADVLDADDDKVIKVLGRDTKKKGDTKQSIASIMGDKMEAEDHESSTGTRITRKAAKVAKLNTKLKAMTDKVEDFTAEEIDGYLDMAGMDVLDTADECDTADKDDCKTAAKVDLKKVLGLKADSKQIDAKINQIALLTAGRKGADMKAKEGTGGSRLAEADIVLKEKLKYEGCGGKRKFEDVASKIKMIREKYDGDKDIVVKKVKAVDVVVSYSGACEDATDAAVLEAVKTIGTTEKFDKVERKGSSQASGGKCHQVMKADKAKATDDELDTLSDKFTVLTGTDRRRLASGRRLPPIDVSASQTTEVKAEDAAPPVTTTSKPDPTKTSTTPSNSVAPVEDVSSGIRPTAVAAFAAVLSVMAALAF